MTTNALMPTGAPALTQCGIDALYRYARHETVHDVAQFLGTSPDLDGDRDRAFQIALTARSAT